MQQRYRVILNGVKSSIITDPGGEHTTFREAKEELANYLKLQIKAYIDRLAEVTTISLTDICNS